MRPAPAAGVSLVECAVVLALAALLAGLAQPSLRDRERRVARLDAVQALGRVQAEQEQYRHHHGLYAAELGALRGVTVQSAQGRYALSLQVLGPEAYRAVAAARGVQTDDRRCPALTLDVSLGFARYGPTPACWNL